MVFSLTYMTKGNKALVLTFITLMLMALGSVMLFFGPDNSQETGNRIVIDDNFTIPEDGHVSDRPSIATQQPSKSPLQAPALPPNNIFHPATPAPTTPRPVPSTIQPTTLAPVTTAPIANDQKQYPFAIAYECDWTGKKLTLTTKTESASVVRLCIEAPPLPDSEEPIEISYLSWFVFERQPYENEVLEPMVQHAVILAKPDPFGLTVMDCHKGAAVCKFATDLRDEFFEVNAFLHGRGELFLQYTTNKQVAGVSPVSIYFLLSASDIKEPLQLGRRAEPVPQATTLATSRTDNKQRLKQRLGQGRRNRKSPLFANRNNR